MSTNIYGWIRLVGLAGFVAYLYRSAVSPREGDPRGRIDRTIRFIGAIIMAIFFVYGVAFMLGFLGSKAGIATH
jgi:hypothetical protein